jgi:hypothetical protein
MRLSRQYDRAYAFRSATEAQRSDRIRRLYPATAAAAPGATPLSQPGSVFGPGAVVRPSLEGVQLASGAVLAELLGAAWPPADLLSLGAGQQGSDAGASEALGALLRACGDAYDQAVPMVAHMRGGSRAGYARWEEFRRCGWVGGRVGMGWVGGKAAGRRGTLGLGSGSEGQRCKAPVQVGLHAAGRLCPEPAALPAHRKGLALYAARRNDALQRDGVSRMSAYLHWGERHWGLAGRRGLV